MPGEAAYQAVVDALAAKVKAMPIADVFLHFEKTVGTDRSFEDIVGKTPKRWDHFFVNVAPKYVMPNKDIATKLGEKRSLKDVFLRGLKEIDLESVDTVLELIAQNTVYRGQESKFAVEGFRKAKVAFDKLKTDAEREQFAWEQSLTVHGAVAGIRNNAIGQMLQWLSEGMGVDNALTKFERTIMAPANYKRPTAAVTPKMIENAKKTISDLGLTSALGRRYAQLSDISINDIMFADRSAKKMITGDVFDELAAATSAKAKVSDKVEKIGIEKFISDVLPNITSMEVLLENRHASNLVSLIAPEDATAGQLFKWGNNFTWSYVGGMADSIKERVKAAGGSVEGDLCCRLAWEYRDDLDFHMKEPGGHKIFFMNRRQLSPNGGVLDLDANGADGQRNDPAENIVYADRRKMKNGVYELMVNNYARRSDGVGFEVELEFDGQKTNIVYDKVMRTGDTITVAKIKYTAGKFEIIESLPSSQSVKTMWNLPSQTFHRVDVAMLSPNYWENSGSQTGNKHYLFMLENCANDAGDARGFLNEFLKEELTPHRKVFEMVGSRIKVSGDHQMSGLGFSSTQRNSIVARVKGSFTRTIEIEF